MIETLEIFFQAPTALQAIILGGIISPLLLLKK
jgi:hypothetical protein